MCRFLKGSNYEATRSITNNNQWRGTEQSQPGVSAKLFRASQ